MCRNKNGIDGNLFHQIASGVWDLFEEQMELFSRGAQGQQVDCMSCTEHFKGLWLPELPFGNSPKAVVCVLASVGQCDLT